MLPQALPANIALITARIDLQVVRLLREAIHTTEIGDLRRADEAIIEPRPTVTPEPRIEPRKSITPEPRIEPRLTYRVEPKVEPAPPQFAEPVQAEHYDRDTSPLQPPWKSLPWTEPLPAPPPPQRVKVVRFQPDMARKGQIINLLW